MLLKKIVQVKDAIEAYIIKEAFSDTNYDKHNSGHFFEISELQSRLFVLKIIFLMTFKPFLIELLEMEEA